MIYENKKSHRKILHLEGCRHVNRHKKKRRAFKDMRSALRQGYRLCKHCNPLVAVWKREGEEAQAFARKNKVGLRFREDCIDLVCGQEKWKVAVANNGRSIALFHKNSVGESEEYIYGYHNQNVIFSTLVGYLKYVVKHWDYRKANPLPKKKKNRKSVRNKQNRETEVPSSTRILAKLKELHNEDYYKDFLCYIK